MVYMFVRHKVADFDAWKSVYEGHRSARESAGLKDLHLWQNQSDPREVFLLFEVSDIEKANAFAGSPDAKEKMEAAGVQDLPEIVFLSEK